MGAFICVISVDFKGYKVYQSILFSQAAICSAGIKRSNEDLATILQVREHLDISFINSKHYDHCEHFLELQLKKLL